jgi:hypothetical protein
MDLVTPKAAAKHELLFNKPASVVSTVSGCCKNALNISGHKTKLVQSNFL